MITSPSVPIDYMSLIHNNCAVVLGHRCDINIASQINESGTWTAHVLKTEKGERRAVFSESHATLPGALEALHNKTAMAVHQFVTTNGFGMPPRISSRSIRARRSSGLRVTPLDESEMISLDEGSATSSDDYDNAEHSSDSDLPPDEPSWVRDTARLVRRLPPRVHMAVRRHPEQHPNPPSYRGMYENRSPDIVGRPPHGSYLPPVGPGAMRPMPPAHLSKQPASVAPWTLQGIPPPPPRMPPSMHGPPAAGSATPAPLKQRAVLMSISWVGHGEVGVLVDCPLNVPAVKTRVAQLVRQKQAEFGVTTPIDFSKVPLQVTMKHLHLGSKAYAIGNFMGNLGEVFDTYSKVPRIDVEVRSVPPMPPANLVSVASESPKPV